MPSYWSDFGSQRVDGVVEEWCSETGMGVIKIVHYERVMGHALLDRSVDKIFVHHTNLHTLGGYRELTVGEEVEDYRYLPPGLGVIQEVPGGGDSMMDSLMITLKDARRFEGYIGEIP